MNTEQFIKTAQKLVAEHSNEMNETKIHFSEVYTVWMCKTLQNTKALLSTNIPDSRYYEVTYNGDKNEFYFDSYVKEINKLVKGDLND